MDSFLSGMDFNVYASFDGFGFTKAPIVMVIGMVIMGFLRLFMVVIVVFFIMILGLIRLKHELIELIDSSLFYQISDKQLQCICIKKFFLIFRVRCKILHVWKIISFDDNLILFRQGLGRVISVTIPVFNRSEDIVSAANQFYDIVTKNVCKLQLNSWNFLFFSK